MRTSCIGILQLRYKYSEHKKTVTFQKSRDTKLSFVAGPHYEPQAAACKSKDGAWTENRWPKGRALLLLPVLLFAEESTCTVEKIWWEATQLLD